MFTTTATAHTDCKECKEAAINAESLATVSGSIGSTWTDGGHSATVTRTQETKETR